MVDDKRTADRASGPAAPDPDDRTLLARAMAQHRGGELAAAEAGYRRLLSRHPGEPGVTGQLGLLLSQDGRAGEAAALMQPVIAAGDSDPGLLNAYALALGALARFPEAVAAARQAAAAAPDVAELQINLGNALRRAGQAEQALAAYERAIALQPGLVAAYIGLGTAQAALGDGAAASEAYRRALAQRPDSLRAFYHWALAAKAGAAAIDPAIVERFEEKAAAALGDDDSIMLHNALGILADRAGAYAHAFAHFKSCNAAIARRLKRRGEAFDAAAHSRFVDALIAAFPSDARPLDGATGGQAIFIVGMPRSGTTLVEQILASHSQVAAGGELPHLPQLVKALGDYPAAVAAHPRAVLRRLADDYLAALDAIGGGATRITDKLPLNFLHLGLIAQLFPAATVVHCQREPLDSCLSCYFHNFRGGNGFACDLALLGAFYRDYRRLMAHWRAALPLRLIEVRYEELVAEPEAAIRALIADVGLSWEEACLSFQRTKRAVSTASQLQVRQAISEKSVGRWRNYAAELAPLIEALGEPPD